MNGIDPWDAILLAVAAAIAVSSLVRLMRGRRNQLVSQVQQQLNQQRQLKARAKAKAEAEAEEAA